MSALADLQGVTAKPSRRQKAAKTVDKALRGGILAGAVAALGWVLATAALATALFVMVIVTVLALIYTVVRGEKARYGVWGLVAIAWALVIAGRWAVHGHGGLLVAGAAWVGIVAGARRAGITKRWMPLLLYPLIPGAIVVLTHHSLVDPWGVSWLWVAAILGPVVGLRTLFNPSPRDHAEPRKPQPDLLADL